MSAARESIHPDLEVIEVNGKRLVSGLWWKPLRNSRTYRTEAKQIGKAENMEMVTIRHGRSVIQAGFAPRRRQRLKGMYSLAAALAGQLGDNWIGAFEVGVNRYALVALYKGAVVPGFDVIGTRDEIEPRLREVYSLLTSNAQDDFRGSGRVIAPKEFGFSDESLQLQDLLTAKTIKSEYRLRPLTLGMTTREIVAIGVGVVALGAAGVGAKIYFDQKREAESREAERAAAVAQVNQASAAAAAAKAGLVRPWTTLPATPVLLDACAAHLHSTALSFAGWQFTNARCAPGKAVASYARLGSSPVADFVEAATKATGSPPGLFEQGTTGSIEAVIAVSPQGSDQLRGTAQLLMDFTTHLQQLGDHVSFTLTEKPYTPDPNKPDAPAPDWTTNGFVIQTKFPPERLFKDLDTSGIRVFEVVTTLTPDTAELAWTINGELYGR